MNVSHIDDASLPEGELSMRTIAMQSDTNSTATFLPGS